ncbi:unnamed protein product, partial [Amoebophrya sp. A25]|eukprot:GSA25T00016857001.1
MGWNIPETPFPPPGIGVSHFAENDVGQGHQVPHFCPYTLKTITAKSMCCALNGNLKVMKRLTLILHTLSKEKLVEAAERCGHHARALLYLEQTYFADFSCINGAVPLPAVAGSGPAESRSQPGRILVRDSWTAMAPPPKPHEPRRAPEAQPIPGYPNAVGLGPPIDVRDAKEAEAHYDRKMMSPAEGGTGVYVPLVGAATLDTKTIHFKWSQHTTYWTRWFTKPQLREQSALQLQRLHRILQCPDAALGALQCAQTAGPTTKVLRTELQERWADALALYLRRAATEPASQHAVWDGVARSMLASRQYENALSVCSTLPAIRRGFLTNTGNTERRQALEDESRQVVLGERGLQGQHANATTENSHPTKTPKGPGRGGFGGKLSARHAAKDVLLLTDERAPPMMNNDDSKHVPPTGADLHGTAKRTTPGRGRMKKNKYDDDEVVDPQGLLLRADSSRVSSLRQRSALLRHMDPIHAQECSSLVLSRYACEAAWRLSDWDQLRDLVERRDAVGRYPCGHYMFDQPVEDVPFIPAGADNSTSSGGMFDEDAENVGCLVDEKARRPLSKTGAASGGGAAAGASSSSTAPHAGKLQDEEDNALTPLGHSTDPVTRDIEAFIADTLHGGHGLNLEDENQVAERRRSSVTNNINVLVGEHHHHLLPIAGGGPKKNIGTSSILGGQQQQNIPGSCSSHQNQYQNFGGFGNVVAPPPGGQVVSIFHGSAQGMAPYGAAGGGGLSNPNGIMGVPHHMQMQQQNMGSFQGFQYQQPHGSASSGKGLAGSNMPLQGQFGLPAQHQIVGNFLPQQGPLGPFGAPRPAGAPSIQQTILPNTTPGTALHAMQLEAARRKSATMTGNVGFAGGASTSTTTNTGGPLFQPPGTVLQESEEMNLGSHDDAAPGGKKNPKRARVVIDLEQQDESGGDTKRSRGEDSVSRTDVASNNLRAKAVDRTAKKRALQRHLSSPRITKTGAGAGEQIEGADSEVDHQHGRVKKSTIGYTSSHLGTGTSLSSTKVVVFSPTKRKKTNKRTLKRLGSRLSVVDEDGEGGADQHGGDQDGEHDELNSDEERILASGIRKELQHSALRRHKSAANSMQSSVSRSANRGLRRSASASRRGGGGQNFLSDDEDLVMDKYKAVLYRNKSDPRNDFGGTRQENNSSKVDQTSSRGPSSARNAAQSGLGGDSARRRHQGEDIIKTTRPAMPTASTTKAGTSNKKPLISSTTTPGNVQQFLKAKNQVGAPASTQQAGGPVDYPVDPVSPILPGAPRYAAAQDCQATLAAMNARYLAHDYRDFDIQQNNAATQGGYS